MSEKKIDIENIEAVITYDKEIFKKGEILTIVYPDGTSIKTEVKKCSDGTAMLRLCKI